MKKIKQINDSTLIGELLDTMVCEKSELVWIVPYSPELHDQIIKEIFSEIPVTEN